ncbi:serine aminopeptidase domain-containing protein [Deinococcus navajonensis]|uniref:Serine aminopeptidase domain-containing protein n=1 Tax=Deinococcus navajonensis TaxID=309884 RepID=A0ABV8XN62_9DEIO
MTRQVNPADPPATPMWHGQPYRVERRVLAGIPCLLELPLDAEVPVRAVCVVYHGAWANKEGKLGVYSALATAGVAVVLPDSALHGERQGDTPAGLNAREYVWESVRRTVAEAPALFSALDAAFGAPSVWVIGSSMGGYVSLTLARSAPQVQRAAALITSGVWEEPEVRLAELRAFLDEHRPISHAANVPPVRLLLASGDEDPVFPLVSAHLPTVQALQQAYAAAGLPGHFKQLVLSGVGHYTSRAMRDAAVSFLLAE